MNTNPYAYQRLEDRIFLNLLAIVAIVTVLMLSTVMRDNHGQLQPHEIPSEVQGR